jgi:hypothetical protein
LADGQRPQSLCPQLFSDDEFVQIQDGAAETSPCGDFGSFHILNRNGSQSFGCCCIFTQQTPLLTEILIQDFGF